MTTAASPFGIYVLEDDEKPYMQITFGRNEDGVVNIDMHTAPITRHEPVRVTLNGACVAEGNLPAPSKACECPDSAESLIGEVHVRHTEGCIGGEPRRYLWLSDGEMRLGTLADYGRWWKESVYQGTAGYDGAGELRTWTDRGFDTYHVSAETLGSDEDWSRHRLSVDGDAEWVIVHLDARA
ncbi:hypothetical protein [Nocardia asiatica]|uniref:hypothetical protein n=1 Tax=Nocardia asiatica TaxID=209252 RepID=UPI00031D88F8|nr:hypothetical protein [Nocardia asiatica]